MSFDESVAKWKGEFLEDDAAVGLLRERVFELGFGIISEKVERKDELGRLTQVNWVLVRNREARATTEDGKGRVMERMSLQKHVSELLGRLK